MAWRRNASNAITVSYLVDREVSVTWPEAVALGLEMAEMTERTGRNRVPRPQNIELMPDGTLEFLSGRLQAGDAVTSLARTLNAILPADRPTQLRLLVSTAGPDSGSCKSVSDYVEALKYFERPGRRATLAELYDRALKTPVPTKQKAAQAVEPPRRPRKPVMSRGRRWALAATMILALGAGGLALAEKIRPGTVTDPATSVQAVALGWWEQALDATSEFRELAARDLSKVNERVQEARAGLEAELGIAEGTEAGGDTEETDTETEPADTGDAGRTAAPSRPVAPPPAPTPVSAPEPEPVEPSTESGNAVVEPADAGTVAETVEPEPVTVEVDEIQQVDVYANRNEPTPLFDQTDEHVMPPVGVGAQLPGVAAALPAGTGVTVVEAIVSASGTVERVKLLSPRSTVHQRMMLSAVKAWRFQPAVRDGDTVRYRQLIPMPIPRCRSRAACL